MFINKVTDEDNYTTKVCSFTNFKKFERNAYSTTRWWRMTHGKNDLFTLRGSDFRFQSKILIRHLFSLIFSYL